MRASALRDELCRRRFRRRLLHRGAAQRLLRRGDLRRRELLVDARLLAPPRGLLRRCALGRDLLPAPRGASPRFYVIIRDIEGAPPLYLVSSVKRINLHCQHNTNNGILHMKKADTQGELRC